MRSLTEPSALSEEQKFSNVLRTLAQAIEGLINRGDAHDNGFVLIVFPFGDDGDEREVRYLSNAEPDDVLALLRDQVARMEGKVGHA
jgi:hypothetical protein